MFPFSSFLCNVQLINYVECLTLKFIGWIKNKLSHINCLFSHRSSEDLVHRLFVCIAGVADQLQTNFAGDLRNILKCVFLMSVSQPSESSESSDQECMDQECPSPDDNGKFQYYANYCFMFLIINYIHTVDKLYIYIYIVRKNRRKFE